MNTESSSFAHDEAEPMRAQGSGEPRRQWRCFYCDEVFTTEGAAADHFGNNMHATQPGCLIDYKVQVEEGGKPQRGRGLLMALRKAELEMDAYRQEDTDLHRALYAKDCERNRAVMRAEEQGYARGLRDGVNLSGDSPERASLTKGEETATGRTDRCEDAEGMAVSSQANQTGESL